MTKPKDKIITDVFIKHAKKSIGKHLKGIILFGSRARGDNKTGSDYDVLVIVDKLNPATKNLVHQVSGNLLLDYQVVFSAFPVSKERYKKEIYNPLFINIRKEGISLYDQ